LDTYSESNKNRIKTLAEVLRRKHNAMEWGASPEFLMEKEGLSYVEYDLSDDSILRRYITEPLKKVIKYIKAAIVVPERLVLIDEELHYARKPFGQAHELGHHIIPEHREIFYVCSEHDLSPNTRAEMEYEANVFASEVLYPSTLMNNIHQQYPMAMETVLQLSQLSKGSIHSSAIQYVLTSMKVCYLLILVSRVDEDGNRCLMIKSQIASPSWIKKYKPQYFQKDQIFQENHVLAKQVFSVSKEDVSKGSIQMTTSKREFQFHTFYNSYLVFALIFED
jgi:Zn-dependent peptidase ImmA (M78 family)